ncbi:unnamed protein product [Blepharisma stoltei]|uniref:Cyclic nucleotide-binding domain-containing protein n=1 Tax=Blepharisma stoltei TaxID=1481888 RepID=A0AAU9K9W4_9CILI|nr:unnamed protein product [Blepharisma stoltei]
MNIMIEHPMSSPKLERPIFARYQRRLSNVKDITSETMAYFNQERNKTIIIKFILSLSPDQRTPEMIEKVYSLTKDLAFFKTIREEHTEDIHYSCCKYLNFEFHPAGSVIIKQGEPGSKFYILIEGSANVIRENDDGSMNLIAEIGDGESFGERSLLLGTKRAATVIAVEDCSLGVLVASDYKKILESFMEDRYNVLIEMLRHLPMFKDQSLNYLQRFTYYFKSKKVKKRQIIFQEGDPADKVYLIQDGEFSLFRTLTVSIKSSKPFPEKSPLKTKNISKQSPIAILSIGTMFGEEEITSGEAKRSTTCICTSNSGLLLIISKENFLKQIMKNDDAVNFIRNRTQKKLQTRQNIFDRKIKVQKLNSGIIPLVIDKNCPKKEPLKAIESLPQLASPKRASGNLFSPRIILNSSTFMFPSEKDYDNNISSCPNKRHGSLCSIMISEASDQSKLQLCKSREEVNFSTLSTELKDSLNFRRQNSLFSSTSSDDKTQNKNLKTKDEINYLTFSVGVQDKELKSPDMKRKKSASISIYKKWADSISITTDKKWGMDSPTIKHTALEDGSPIQRKSLGASSSLGYLCFDDSGSPHCKETRQKNESNVINMHTHLMKSKSKKYHKFNSLCKTTKRKIKFYNENQPELQFQDMEVKSMHYKM